MAKILIPLPSTDFDPTEVAIPWKVLTQLGHELIFSTSDGKISTADFRMLEGKGLGPLQSLRAQKIAIDAHAEMVIAPEFSHPKKWKDLKVEDYSAIILPGGHAKGMRPYLESKTLHNLVASFFQEDKLVAAICHGVVLAARSKRPDTGRSVLFGRKTTALPRWMEFSAWGLTCLWLGNYYRTYRQSVQSEVIANLETKKDFSIGPLSFIRDSATNAVGFVKVDGNYISARWPGDAHLFAQTIHSKLI